MDAINTLRSRLGQKQSPSLMTGQQRESAGAELSSREPVQVEPKTYFANERTFIQWISAALLLLTVSSIMMGSGNFNGTSSVIAFSSMVLVGYAAFTYFRRVNLLRSGEAYGYLDFLGPSILAVGVGLGVFIVFADAVKGSEFLSWGGRKEGRQRSLVALSHMIVPEENYYAADESPVLFPALLETKSLCTRHSLQGINLLEYQPRDIMRVQNNDSLIVATPQSLILHPLGEEEEAVVLIELADVELQSIAWIGQQLIALTTGPARTELLVLTFASRSKNDHHRHGDTAKFELESRHVIQESTSQIGSLLVLPPSHQYDDEVDNSKRNRIMLYLDGTMHTYQFEKEQNGSSASLVRTGSVNMKVLNQGRQQQHPLLHNRNGNDNDGSMITSMEYFEGITYLLRSHQNLVQAWDLNNGRATLLTEWTLPGSNTIGNEDRWMGMVLERRTRTTTNTNYLRHGEKEESSSSSVYLHMPLDSYPPQLWSFQLQEQQQEQPRQGAILSPPQCIEVRNSK